MSFYVLFPPVYKKELQETENFQTTQQHKNGTKPLG